MSRSGSGSPGPRSGSISGRRSCASCGTRTRTSSSAGAGPTRRPRRESPWTSRRTPRPRDLREGPLGLEELSLRRGAAGPCVVPPAAGGGDDPVAGHDEDRRIPGAHIPDGPRGPGLAEASREVPVRHDLPGRDRPEELEDLPLERGHIEVQRNVPKVLGSRPEVLEDPGEVRMVPAVEPLRGPRREVPPRAPVPPDREVDVEPEVLAEPRVEAEGLRAGGLPSLLLLEEPHPDDGGEGPDEMGLRRLQVLLERAPGDPQAAGDVWGRDLPRGVVVAGLEGREDRLALPLREGREEEPRGEELPVDVSAAEGDLGGQGRVGEDPSEDGGGRLLEEEEADAEPTLPPGEGRQEEGVRGRDPLEHGDLRGGRLRDEGQDVPLLRRVTGGVSGREGVRGLGHGLGVARAPEKEEVPHRGAFDGQTRVGFRQVREETKPRGLEIDAKRGHRWADGVPG